MNIFKIVFFLLVSILGTIVLAQSGENENKNKRYFDYQVSSEKYFTDENGNIKMFVSVWGHVNNPGLHEVYDGIDIATLLSVVGGPLKGAKLNSIKIYRGDFENSNDPIHEIDVQKFLNNGDRSSFVKIMPNDTVYIPQKTSNYVIQNGSIVNLFVGMINLIFTLRQL